MSVGVIYASLLANNWINRDFFAKFGIEIGFEAVSVDYEILKDTINTAFQLTEGLIIIYDSLQWHNIQKIMMQNFQRSLIFVDVSKPYVIAKGFKRIAEGVFFDNIDGKPVAFIDASLKKEDDFGKVAAHFVSDRSIVKVFGRLEDQKLEPVFRDEVEEIYLLKKEEIEHLKDNLKVYSTDGASESYALVDVLKVKNAKIATAESCTAGLVAAKIADVAGVSEFLEGGFVTYSNKMKVNQLKVSSGVLYRVGAVSREVAEAMAAGAIASSGADFAVSTTGIAGPTGGSDTKPVGLVWFGVAGKNGVVRATKMVFSGNRAAVREKAARFAILYLREFILSQ
ncbi:CinA family protein [Hippea jasoniae]|uniref:CinA family protein n=1 Tax=Hippea jasoniae TaxID=944479 RepID=UPI000B22CA73|nr:CinA family protein [Hippea jasoniae]